MIGTFGDGGKPDMIYGEDAAPDFAAGADQAPEPAFAVRPYVFTGGRTKPRFDLAIEALVTAVAAPPGPPRTMEQDEVVRLCGEARSVAEIAALMRVPLGVARVLIGDLAMAGLVEVHSAPGEKGPDLALLERVLSGLRRL
ncbi:DUF742 domain-containing protein [Pseudonocardia sp. TRM90224]|uniref:DUF742 domain-containing protein n=1 Tax=Pseudonocardia sp. TRM90224 TaxID=2812678 RepID=UPI001E5740AF|nr:DUF742 domain-containing protein [Pseudonocardia sp. TRM90224]